MVGIITSSTVMQFPNRTLMLMMAGARDEGATPILSEFSLQTVCKRESDGIAMTKSTYINAFVVVLTPNFVYGDSPPPDMYIRPEYRFSSSFIHLKNGLRTMLISSLKPGETADSETDSASDAWDECEEEEAICHDDEVSKAAMRKSAAALCVNVGYFTDPVEAQGLAHFLEHMVFMGSEKYPRENDFDDYVEHRGGSSNACTDGDYTLFFFDIQRVHFEEALDKFANFFIAPLLSQDCVDRELEAIHSEFELCKADDSCRLDHLLTSFSKGDSPYHTFGVGNRTSLRDKPSAAGTNVYELLRKFQLRYYNASLMTLAVESK
ncbi:Nardilysin, partial [Taenia solium]|eukprot:TsM_000806200 transcript=TsM_000806200 gene=TsM_000806200